MLKESLRKFFHARVGWKLHYLYFFLSFHQLSFLLFPTLFLFCLHFYIQIGSYRKFGFQHFLYLFALRILAQFYRNCCGIAFQRMVRWTGTRWGAGGSDWWFGSSWASFCFSMQWRTLDRGKREMGGTGVSVFPSQGFLNLLSFWVGGLILACSFFHAAEKLSSWLAGLVGFVRVLLAFLQFWLRVLLDPTTITASIHLYWVISLLLAIQKMRQVKRRGLLFWEKRFIKMKNVDWALFRHQTNRVGWFAFLQ